MLNHYHIEFLNHLTKNYVSFLVIGGQAKKILTPSHSTNDLDIWLSLDDNNKKRSSYALQKWKEQYPLHSNTDFTTPLRPRVQIHFPETDCKELTADMGIDILTSIESMSFNECMGRAIKSYIEFIEIQSLCEEDLKKADSSRKPYSPTGG